MSQTAEIGERQDDDDPFDLNRFLKAQKSVYEGALSELKSGRKRTHWMWFIFPQIVGLGYSAASQVYAIKSREEAQAYLAHPVLGARLRECAGVLLSVNGRSAHDIFGSPDDAKLRSSMTLFEQAAGPDSIFSRVLEKYFGGKPDDETLRRL